MPNYQYTDLKSAILGDNIDAPTSIRDRINEAVREVISLVDLRSTKRSTQLSPNLYEEVYVYGSPSDLKGLALIDIRKQVKRSAGDRFSLRSVEEFDALKTEKDNIVAIQDWDFIRKLLISAKVDSDEAVLHDMESITGDGTWSVSGDASNLSEDSNNYINGSASLNFDMGASWTSGILVNSAMDAVDLSDYENEGQIFLWIYIPDTTDITNFTLRWGSDSSNYFSKAVTTNHEGLAFHTGWNLLRFDWQTATETGTVDNENIDYLRLAITGGGSASASTDWRVDYIVSRKGVIHYTDYYSKYAWQTSAGVWRENSTVDTDYINCDTEELNLFKWKGRELLFGEDTMYNDAQWNENKFNALLEKYIERYPSEALILESDYYDLNTIYG